MYIRNRLGMTESVETMLAQQGRMDQAANNLANVDTPGFKREHVTFWEMLYTASDNRQRVGKGIKPLTDFAGGPAKMTGNPLDLSISGDGFFKIQTAAGVRYSRAGTFQLNNQGQLTMPDGSLVLGEGGTIVLTDGPVEVGLDGSISQHNEIVGVLAIVGFQDLSILERDGLNLFRLKEGEAGGQVPKRFEIRQGYLEQSNTQTIEEMTAMIDLYRDYETQQKAIRSLDDIDGMAVQRVGKLTG